MSTLDQSIANTTADNAKTSSILKTSDQSIRQSNRAQEALLKDTHLIKLLKEKKEGNLLTDFMAEYGVIGVTVGTAMGFMISNVITDLTDKTIQPMISKKLDILFKKIGIMPKNFNSAKEVTIQLIIFIIMTLLLFLMIMGYNKYMGGRNTQKEKNDKILQLRDEINQHNLRSANDKLTIISKNLETITNYLITSH
jgi:large-conductance mechanosensitive channel